MNEVMLTIIMNGTNALAQAGGITAEEAERLNKEDTYAASLEEQPVE